VEHRNPGYKVDARLNFPLRGHVLISELVWGDFLQYLNAEGIPDEMDAYTFMEDVFQAILDMQLNMGIKHRDLHVGNILVTDDPDITDRFRPMPLIHDFGFSTEADFSLPSRGEHLEDVERIVTNTIAHADKIGRETGRLPIHPSIYTHLDNLKDRLGSYRSGINIVEDVLAEWRRTADPTKRTETEEMTVEGGSGRQIMPQKDMYAETGVDVYQMI
jgi:hypothetical protein